MSNSLRIKGFTLVELISVIAILAILVLITAPVIFNLLKSANENTFLDTAYAINKAANNYYTALATSDNTVPLLITYNEGEITSQMKGSEATNTNYLDYTGSDPYSGNVYISESGEVEMAIYDNRSGICVVKEADDKNPVKTDRDSNSCKLNKTIS